MKITHTDIYRFSIPMEPFVIATGTMYFAQNVLIRVHTDEGINGVGECSAFPMIVGETQETCLAMARDFAAIWKGKNPLEIEERMQDLHNYTAHNGTVKSAFDMALYDIASKASAQPLYKFLGGRKRIVESDMTIGIASSAEMAESAIKYKNDGATILKVKLGKNAIEDIERMKRIRAAVGPDVGLRIDANQGWSFEDAKMALNGMKDINIEFCEQPMRTWFDDLLPDLIASSPIKIMADESCYNHHDARKLIKHHATDYINIKFSKSGGILEALKIQSTAEDAGIKCMIGSMLESRLALSAKLHFVYAAPNVHFFDLDTCKLGHLVDPVIDGAQYNGYHLDIDEKPGIGADVNEEFLAKCDSWTI